MEKVYHKGVYFVITFIRNIQDLELHRDGKQRLLGVERKWGVTTNGFGISFWDNKMF